ncbi:MAG: hypothetical protein KAQ98_11570 [Bacteriovoracaceae bacterium]|nr:hypothetical protein [Bacteriovoracaceae bacterium]
MKIEYFTTLIEVQSLENYIHVHLKKIDYHKKRISDIEEKRKNAKEDLNEKTDKLSILKTKIKKDEARLYDLETKLSKTRENMKVVTTNQQISALEKEIEVLVPQRDSLEENSLEVMEKIEILETDVTELEGFLNGSEKTMQEIKTEVESNIRDEQHEIDNYNERVENLLSLIPPQMCAVFKNVNKKYKYKNPLTFVENNTCIQCSFIIERNLSSSIEKGTIIELCPNCERLLIPHAARNSS